MGIARLAAGACLTFAFVVTAAASALNERYFSSGASVWIVSPESILWYRGDTRQLRSVAFSPDEDDSVADAFAFETILYVTTSEGLSGTDMGTGTRERIELPPGVAAAGVVGANYDYVWYCAGPSLYRFDKLSREWETYARREALSPLALTCTEDNVYVVSGAGVEVFGITDERWRAFGRALDTTVARVRPVEGGVCVIESTRIRRFAYDTESWQEADVPGVILDAALVDTIAYCSTPAGVFSVHFKTAAVSRLSIAGLDSSSALSFSRKDTSLYAAGPRTIAVYSLSSGRSEQVEYAVQARSTVVHSMQAVDSMLLVFHPQDLAVRSFAASSWETVALGRKEQGARKAWWNDDGLGVRYSKSSSSVLQGYTAWRLKLHNDTMFVDTVGWRNAIPDETDLMLHTALGRDRYLDVFYNDTRTGQVPDKGVHYGGAQDDILRSAHAGTFQLAVAESRTFADVKVEGVSAEFQSKSRVEGRDRRVVRAVAAGGYLVSQTRREVLRYRPGRNYRLSVFGADSAGQADTVQIVPRSVRVSVDGEQLDTSAFRVFYTTGVLQFARDDIIDPTSIIVATYQVRTIADSGAQTVEIIPQNRFGEIAHADVTVSPLSWLSARAGYDYLWNGARHDIVSAALPLELRNNRYMLKFNPEYSFDAQNADGARAGSFALSARAGTRLALEARGFLADSAYTSTDILSYGYGNRQRDIEYALSYDIAGVAPVRLYQHNRRATGGGEDRYELSAGLRMANAPQVDLQISRIDMDAVFARTAADSSDTATVDSIGSLKHKLRLRLYETSSSWLKRLTRVSKAGYEISYTEFGALEDGDSVTQRGRSVYGLLSVFPISALSINLSGTYRANPEGMRFARDIEPSLTILATDLPKGVDFAAAYYLDFGRMALSDSSQALLTRSAELTVRPGAWWKALAMLTLRGRVREFRTCMFDTRDPSAWAVIAGTESVTGSTLQPSAGFELFPSSKILFTSQNDWTMADTVSGFLTVDDLKLRLGRRDLWHTRYQFESRTGIADKHQAHTRYEKSWTSWLSTKTGVVSSYSRGDDRIVTIGPDIAVDVYLREKLFIRRLDWSNAVRVDWSRVNGVVGWSPDISYTMALRAVVLPAISFEMNHLLVVKQARADPVDYAAAMKLALLF